MRGGGVDGAWLGGVHFFGRGSFPYLWGGPGQRACRRQYPVIRWLSRVNFFQRSSLHCGMSTVPCLGPPATAAAGWGVWIAWRGHKRVGNTLRRYEVKFVVPVIGRGRQHERTPIRSVPQSCARETRFGRVSPVHSLRSSNHCFFWPPWRLFPGIGPSVISYPWRVSCGVPCVELVQSVTLRQKYVSVARKILG